MPDSELQIHKMLPVIPGLPGAALSVRDMQAIELETLGVFDDFCRQHELTYWLFDGTLLGAIRHGGFIPWDDDIDVVMPLMDYRRLVSLHNQGIRFEAPYRLSAHDLTDAPPNLTFFARLYDERAQLHRNNVLPSLRQDEGAWIDIFPLCGLPAGEQQKQFLDRLHFLHVMEYLAVYRFEFSDARGNILKRLAKTAARLAMLIPARVRGYRHWLAAYQQLLTQSPVFGSSEACFVAPYTNHVYPTQDFSKTIPLLFEGRAFPAPAGHDSLLTIEYGDYMTPPPLEQQVSDHHVAIVWRSHAE
jgi:lipopolysaccharide cholinephosphotransferase